MAIIKSYVNASKQGWQSQTQSISSAENNNEEEVEAHEEEELSANERDSQTTAEEEDLEVAEVGAELIMVGEQTCSVPYELLELQDLSQILCLDTWNNCLTEEERFQLAAYLPDMSQHTFSLTLKQLLEGGVFYFSSPMTDFFNSLKGGLYEPETVKCRKALGHLQMMKHYHQIRDYHNKMVNTFLEMQDLWKKFSVTSADARVSLWISSKLNGNLAVPSLMLVEPVSAAELARKKSGKAPLQNGKTIRILKSPNPTDVGAAHISMEKSMNKVHGNGVLKIKSPAKILIPMDIGHAQFEAREPLPPSQSQMIEKRTRTGVLKIASSLPARNEHSVFKPNAVSSMEPPGYDVPFRIPQQIQGRVKHEGELLGDAYISEFKSKDRKKKNVSEPEEARLSLQRLDMPCGVSLAGSYSTPYDKKIMKGKELRVPNMRPQFSEWHAMDGRNIHEEGFSGSKCLPSHVEDHRFSESMGAFQENTGYSELRHIDRQCRGYPGNSIEQHSDGGELQGKFGTSFSRDQEGTLRSYLDQHKQKGSEKSKQRNKDIQLLPEDKFRIVDERRITKDGQRDRISYFEGQSSFSGDRRQVSERNTFVDEKSWFDQGKSNTESRKHKNSQIGKDAYQFDQFNGEAIAIEDAQVSKKHKKRKDNAKGIVAERHQPQVLPDKQKMPKIRFKTRQPPELTVEPKRLM